MQFKKVAAAMLAAAMLGSFAVQTVGAAESASLADPELPGVELPGVELPDMELYPGIEFVDGDLMYCVLDDGTLEVRGLADEGLEELIIPEEVSGKKVTGIGGSAFSNASLTSVVIPDGVTTIGEYAFLCCESLTSVTIPNSVTTIGSWAFSSTAITSAAIPDGMTEIGDYVFNNCESLASVTIPDGVTTIGESAFGWCVSLASVTLPDSVTTIGDSAFNGCGITSFTIPDGVTAIGDWTFGSGCQLTSITIPGSVTSIGSSAFGGYLKTVNYGGTKAEWEAIEIDEQNWVFTSAQAEIKCTDGTINAYLVDGDLKYQVLKDDTLAVVGFQSTELNETAEKLIIPETVNGIKVTSVRDGAFSQSSLTSVTIPGSVKTIGGFGICASLTNITILDGATTIGENAFFCCESLTNVTIPGSVKTIGMGAFAGCTSLTSVTLPNSLTTIGMAAFESCEALKTVNYGGTKAEWEAIEIGEYTECLTNAEIIYTESDTINITNEETGVKAEISAEDKELEGTKFEVAPADHPKLLDLIKKIVETGVETVTEEVRKSLDEAAEAVKDGKGFTYDMSFMKDGKEVQPDKSVTVTVPVPEKFKDDINKLNVYHLTNRGAVYVPSKIKDGSIVFKTDSFSPYVITVEKLANAIDESDAAAPGGSDKDNADGNQSTGTDQKPTGITLAIAPVMLAAGAAIVLSKKRK